jgi:hypothetical protein
MKVSPRLKLVTPATLTLAATLCISCDQPGKENPHQKKNAAPAVISRQPARETSRDPRENSVQQQVEIFFSELSIALANENSAKASAMISEEKRERFREGFRFYKGTHFFDPMVVRVSEDKALIDVKVSFKTAQGKEDREIKKLKFTDGKWLLLDS